MPEFKDPFDAIPGEFSDEVREERERNVPVTLPIKYWLIVHASLSITCRDVAERIRKLADEGKTVKDLNEGQVSVLMAPIYARAAVTEMLADEMVMTPSARQKFGWPLLERIKAGGHAAGTDDE